VLSNLQPGDAEDSREEGLAAFSRTGPPVSGGTYCFIPRKRICLMKNTFFKTCGFEKAVRM
jgi:hypothetical protein